MPGASRRKLGGTNGGPGLCVPSVARLLLTVARSPLDSTERGQRFCHHVPSRGSLYRSIDGLWVTGCAIRRCGAAGPGLTAGVLTRPPEEGPPDAGWTQPGPAEVEDQVPPLMMSALTRGLATGLPRAHIISLLATPLLSLVSVTGGNRAPISVGFRYPELGSPPLAPSLLPDRPRKVFHVKHSTGVGCCTNFA